MLPFSGSETSKMNPTVELTDESAKKHVLNMMKKESAEAFYVTEQLFKNPKEYASRVYKSLIGQTAQILVSVALAMILDVGLSKEDYEKIKRILDSFGFEILPCYTRVWEEKDK